MRTRSSRAANDKKDAPSRARLALATTVLAALITIIPLGAASIKNGCTMTRMWPYYEDANINHGRYGVLRYRERNRDPYEAKNGAILFLPGNAGDARQVRSLGHEVDLLRGAAVYACDFRGEWSAFDGRIVARQARFAKRVSKILAKRHGSQVVVVGHSMGGVVGLLAADATKTISAVVALAAPLAAHPFAFERQLAGIYPLPLETPLAKISGGPRDWQAPSWLVGGVEASSLPGAAHIGGVDHQCACWCNELITRVAHVVHAPSENWEKLTGLRGSDTAGASLSAARRHFYPGLAGASQLASFLVPRVPSLLIAAALAPTDIYTFTALMALIVEPDGLSKAALAFLLIMVAYVVAIPFGAALGPAANRAAKAVSHGACAEVVARKVATVRWAAAALCGVHPALGLYLSAWTCPTADGGPLWAAALSSLPSLASAATARRAWSPDLLTALVCLGLGVGRRRRICRRLGALWAAYGAAAGQPSKALEALGVVALLDLGAEFVARRQASRA